MRLIFMGTPEFAIKSLETLHRSKHDIVAVVTAPDKPRGRGRKIMPTAVKKAALEMGLPVLQPSNLKSQKFVDELKDLNPDLNVVVAFRILPEVVFKLPKYGSVNLHGSLLPKYRGAAPINWAIINGEKTTGVTTFLLDKKVDTGAILLQKSVDISAVDDAGTIHDKLMDIGAELLLKTVDGIDDGSLKPATQNDIEASPAPKLTPETGKINWSENSEKLFNLIRGLSPYPGAYGYLKSKKIIILKCDIIGADNNKRHGEIIESDQKTGITVACGEGALKIITLKPQGKTEMGSAEYVRGYHVEVGDRFE